MGTLTIVRGACATGKSTRVTLLLRYLMDKYEYEHWSMKKGDPIFGYRFPEINVFIIARYMAKRDHFIGLDAYSGTQEEMDRILESMNSMNVVMEGFMGCMPRYRRRPNHILNNDEYPHPRFNGQVTKGLGFDKMLSIMFLYHDIESMQKRVLGRGGKLIDESCSSWRDNKLLLKYANEELIENPELFDRISSRVYCYDAPIEIIKDDVLGYLGIREEE